MDIKGKVEKFTNIVEDKGAAYLARRTVFQAGMKLNGSRIVSYEEFKELCAPVKKEIVAQREEYRELQEDGPKVLVMLCTDGSDADIESTKASLKAQTYRPCKVLIGSRDHIRTHVENFLGDNGGDVWVLILRAGDVLPPDYIYRLLKCAEDEPENALWYTDHVVMEGGEARTHFKPDFNEEQLCAYNYIGEVFMVRADALLLMENTDAYACLLEAVADLGIGHCSDVWYETTVTERESDASVDELIKNIFTGMCKEETDISVATGDGVRNVSLSLNVAPLVDVLIPNMDHAEDLDKCLRSLEKQSVAGRLHVIIIENNSKLEETESYYESLGEAFDMDIEVVRWEGTGFNYAALNNFGEKHAKGEYLLLLNNDVELMGENAVEKLFECMLIEGVGAVGAKLYYEDGSVQHAGVIVGMGGVAGHACVGARDGGYLNSANTMRRVSAVTAACMLIDRALYQKIGGFNEEFAVDFNDVDLCLRIVSEGRKIIYQPQCEGVHYESKSRGKEMREGEALSRYNADVERFRELWSTFLAKGDPYYSPNLTLSRMDYSCGNPFLLKK
ncbi:MAG: glycosyltransferase [Lachnospiraceae bacterium]|nr:glycosyltransferase [Lachnospiraceae bacterium]